MQDGIAIIGMSGKFPKAKNITEVWDNITQGVEGITFYTDEELMEAGIAQEVLDDPRYIKAKGEVEGIDLFDASFFGYTPREAELMDPQHRLFLECAWEAMEDAGYDPERTEGRVGVFAGESLSTYMILNVVPNFDTSYASAGAPKKNGYLFEKAGILSPDGHCRPYDAQGHGFVPGTGVGVVLLKRLDEALEDGDHIYAAIKGFAVNNDGAQKVSYSAPSADAQTEVIMEAQRYAGFPPESITYLEGHGTATKLGDVIEVSALKRAFGDGGGKKNFCALGSVKSNIGHLDTAAGVTGLIKAALCIKKKQISPTINYQKANPQLEMEDSPFFFFFSLTDWNPPGSRRAGVSSFGMGGTNAHVVLEEVQQIKENPADERKWKLVTLSAKTDAALNQYINNVTEFMVKQSKPDLSSLAYTSQVGRKRLDKRAAILCKVVDLESGFADLETIRIIKGQTSRERHEIVYLFLGQGAQYLNMEKELYDLEPVFREAVNQCSELFEPYLGKKICNLIFDDSTNKAKSDRLMEDTSVAQPAIFTVEYAMAKLLIGWGIRPDAVIGHSLGEFAAACISGLIELRDAIKLIAHRGCLMESMPEGAMLSVATTPEDAMQLVERYPDISLAAINGPLACVFSGSCKVVEQMEKDLAAEGVLCSRLKNKHAFHSADAESIVDEFRSVLREITMTDSEIRCVSNVDGGYFDREKLADKEYWIRHLRGTVHFIKGMQTLQNGGGKLYIEVGSGKTLSSFTEQILVGSKYELLSTMPHHSDQTGGEEYLDVALGQLWTLGVEIDWVSYYQGRKYRRISFPSYPFEKKSFWLDSPGLRKGIAIARKREKQYEEQEVQEKIENRPELNTAYVQPEKEIEKRVALIWERLLGITQMFSRIYSEFEVKVDYRAFYACPTVRTITEIMPDSDEQKGKKLSEDEDELEALLRELENMSEEDARGMLEELHEGRG